MCCSVLPLEIVMHNAYIGRHLRWTKITRKASDAAENLQLYRVVRFFHPRSSCTTTHILADVQRITLNASCMTISGGRTKQLDIFCHVTGFTSDFLSFMFWNLIGSFMEPFNYLITTVMYVSYWCCQQIIPALEFLTCSGKTSHFTSHVAGTGY